MVATEGQVPGRIPGVERELRWSEGDELLYLGAIEAHRSTLPIDPRSGAGEGIERPVAQAFHADLLEDAQRGPVDRLDLVGAHHLEGPERVAERSPGQSRYAAGDTAGTVARRFARAFGRQRALAPAQPAASDRAISAASS